MDNFTNIELTNNNLDIYIIRKAIFDSLNKNMHLLSGRILDIGCGKMPYKEYLLSHSNITNYVGLDIENALIYDQSVKPDITWNGITMPFQDNVFDSAFGTEVLEHCPYPEIVLKETYRVLKPNGIFFFTVPFLWNLHEVPNDEYRYTPFSIKRHLLNSGFKDISITATGGWHASMAQMLGLWVCRSPITRVKRKFLSTIIKPIIKYLAEKDNTQSINFNDAPMITGLYGIAIKRNE